MDPYAFIKQEINVNSITLEMVPDRQNQNFSTYSSDQIGVQRWPKWEGRIKGNFLPFCEWIPWLCTEIAFTQSSTL